MSKLPKHLSRDIIQTFDIPTFSKGDQGFFALHYSFRNKVTLTKVRRPKHHCEHVFLGKLGVFLRAFLFIFLCCDIGLGKALTTHF